MEHPENCPCWDCTVGNDMTQFDDSTIENLKKLREILRDFDFDSTFGGIAMDEMVAGLDKNKHRSIHALNQAIEVLEKIK